MAWITVPGSNGVWEYDDNPSDPGEPYTTLWEKQSSGVRISTFDGTEIYTKCRRIGSSLDTMGELNKTYYDSL